MSGTLALVGGLAWTDGCSFDAELLAQSGGTDVALLPTAAAYERPQQQVALATGWFQALGATVTEIPVLGRREALDDGMAAAVRSARFLYLASGSAMHLRSVLKDTPVWEALCEAHHGGAVLAASSGAAMALTEPMVDPRGGAFSLGLGLVPGMALIAHVDRWSSEKTHRTIDLAPKGLAVAAVPERTALIRDPSGWRSAGEGAVRVWCDGAEVDLGSLPT